MCHLKCLLSERDVADTDFGEALPMSLLLRVVLTSLHLEDDDLLVAAVLNDLGLDRRALERWHADESLVTVGAEDHVVELDLGSGFAWKTWNSECFAGLGAVLLAAGSDDCVRH